MPRKAIPRVCQGIG
jgi:NADH:ubiquinone oxidoreductase subunit C